MAEIYPKTSVRAAIICGESSVMNEVADEILIRAKGLASRHVKTGSYIDSLKVGSEAGAEGVRDREVYSDDPLALIIEHGTKDTKGQYILTRAAGLTPGGLSDA